MEIQRLRSDELSPMDLLLLADPSEKMIRKYLVQGQCHVAKVENKIIGVYVLLPIKPKTVEIVNVAVHEKEQGKGIGKQLIVHAIDKAKLQGFLIIEIGTGNSSIGQLAFYQKCGFRITDIDKDFFTRNYEEQIVENGIMCRDMIRLSMAL